MFVRAYLKERQREYKKKSREEKFTSFFLICVRARALSLSLASSSWHQCIVPHIFYRAVVIYTQWYYSKQIEQVHDQHLKRERQSNTSWLWIHRHHYKISLIVNIQVQSILHSIVRYLSIQRTISQVNRYSMELLEEKSFMSREEERCSIVL